MTLTLIDWLVIVIYMAGCLVAGLWMRRYVRGVEEFAIAARDMDLDLGHSNRDRTQPHPGVPPGAPTPPRCSAPDAGRTA